MNRYYQLTREQRYQISALKETGLTQKEIAAQLGRSPATISREIRRNTNGGKYDPEMAEKLCRKRRQEAGKAMKITEEMWAEIEDLLRQEWSPEQISGRLSERDGTGVSHEWIYRYVALDRRLGGDLYTHLRHGFKRRKRYGKRDLRGHIRGRVSIEERPAVVDERARIGDWELDTIHGSPRGGNLVSAVERRSGLTRLGKVANRQAAEVRTITTRCLAEVSDRVLTMTSDNGKEFADHQGISKDLGADFYFAHPYASWERGLNENTNGLVRQYFPKGTDFLEIEPWEIQWVEDRINNRPRKRLGYATPNEVFFGETEAADHT